MALAASLSITPRENNNLTINDSEIFRNAEDGIEILGNENTVGLFGVRYNR